MTRKEYGQIVKACFIGTLCALPIIIVFNLLTSELLSTFVRIVLSVTILVAAGVAGFFAGEKRKAYIEKKKQELRANKE